MAPLCSSVIEDAPWILPELTASFVVIGSRLMFESGYEQYLPIEKVITHPQFRGWTADLALVYTFAVMTADKPGHIIPIAGNRSLTPVDSNVTVLSWGYCKGTEDANVRTSEVRLFFVDLFVCSVVHNFIFFIAWRIS